MFLGDSRMERRINQNLHVIWRKNFAAKEDDAKNVEDKTYKAWAIIRRAPNKRNRGQQKDT